MSRRRAPREPRCSTPHLTPLQKGPGRPVRSVGPEIGVDMRLEALDFPARSLAEGLLSPSVTVPSTSKKPTQHGKLKRQVQGIVPRTVSVSQWDRPPRISNHANHLGQAPGSPGPVVERGDPRGKRARQFIWQPDPIQSSTASGCHASCPNMDPLSIVSASLGLASVIAKVSATLTTFARDTRDAAKDLDAVSDELKAISIIIVLIGKSMPSPSAESPISETLLQHIDAMLSGTAALVEQIEENVQKYQSGKTFSKAGWAMFGQGDMQKLRQGLESYKMALSLAMHVLSTYALLFLARITRS